MKNVPRGLFSNSKIKSILIGSTIETIDELSFNDVSELETISFEKDSTLTTIGNYAFQNCKKLKEIQLPKSLTQINFNTVFEGCSNELVIHFEKESRFQSSNFLIYSNNMTVLEYKMKRNDDKHFIVLQDVIDMRNEILHESETKFISLNKKITEIPENAFINNYELISIVIPQNIKTIHSSAFAFDEQLETVIVLSDSITIENDVFHKCSKLSTVIFTSSSITIDSENSFEYLTELNEIIVSPNALVSNEINKITRKQMETGSCGSDCTYILLESTKLYVVGNGNIETFDSIETNKKQLIGEVIIVDGIISINEKSFTGFISLKSITIGRTVKYIENAFDSSSSINSIEYKGINHIECDSSISESFSINYIDVPITYGLTSETTVQNEYECGTDCVFNHNKESETVVINGLLMNDYETIDTVPWKDQLKTIKTVEFNGVTHIGDNAFNGAIELKSILLPASVVSNGKRSFMNSGIEKIIYLGISSPTIYYSTSFNFNDLTIFVPINYESEHFCEKEIQQPTQYADYKITGDCGTDCHYYFDIDEGEMIINGTSEMNEWKIESQSPWYVFRSLLVSVFIDEGIKSLGSYAFNDCPKLEIIKLPESLEIIGNYSIINCKTLKYVYHYSSTIPKIGKELLTNCSISTIHVFNTYSTTEYDSVKFKKADGKTGDVYYVLDDDKTFLVYGYGNMIDYYDTTQEGVVKTPWKYQRNDILHIRIEYGVEYIGQNSFYYENETTSDNGYLSVQSLTISNSVKTVGSFSFWRCENLKTIKFGKRVDTIGQRGFKYCYKLAELHLPETISSLDQYSFEYCTSLTTVTVPKNIKTFGYGVFKFCSSLQEATILSSSVTLSSELFYSCSQLVTVNYYGLSEPSCTSSTFSGCSVINNFNVPKDYSGTSGQVTLCSISLTVSKIL